MSAIVNVNRRTSGESQTGEVVGRTAKTEADTEEQSQNDGAFFGGVVPTTSQLVVGARPPKIVTIISCLLDYVCHCQ